MSLKLSRLKRWLTLEDSAKYLSLLISEEVTVTDLLQLALQSELTVSINLVNSYPAQLGPKVSVQDAVIYKAPLLGGLIEGKAIEEIAGQEKRAFLDALTGKVPQNRSDTIVRDNMLTRRVAKNDSEDSLPEYAVYFEGDALPDNSGVLEFNRSSIQQINGIWDLPMVGSEGLVVEELFYGEIDGPSVDWVRLSGVILKHPSLNRWANLCERLREETKGTKPNDFYPRGDLPDREPLVIRRDELQRFADSLNEPETGPTADETDIELRRTLRTLAALAVGLASKYPAYKHGNKPNASQLAKLATEHLRDATSDRTPHGFSETTARQTIAEALRACPELG